MLTILEIISSIGLTFIITKSFLFKVIRDKCVRTNEYIGKLVTCTMCTGFWSIYIVRFIEHIFPAALYGFITSLVSYIVYLLLSYFIQKYDSNKSNNL